MPDERRAVSFGPDYSFINALAPQIEAVSNRGNRGQTPRNPGTAGLIKPAGKSALTRRWSHQQVSRAISTPDPSAKV